MGRAESATYLASSLAELLSDAGLATTDTAGDLKEPIDDALLLTGTAYDDLATATVAGVDVIGYRKVLTYTALLRIRGAIAHRVDVALDGPTMSKRRSQAAQALDRLVAEAKAAAEPFIANGASGTWGSGTITLDYLEPVVLT
jgi:hypothetical protein